LHSANIYNALQKIGETDIRMAYLDAIVRTNKDLVKEMSNLKTVPLYERDWIDIFIDAFRRLYEEEGWLPDYVEKIYHEAVVKTHEAEAKAHEAESKTREAENKAHEAENKEIEKARAMFNDGFPLETVIKYSPLPKEKIESLARGGNELEIT